MGVYGYSIAVICGVTRILPAIPSPPACLPAYPFYLPERFPTSLSMTLDFTSIKKTKKPQVLVRALFTLSPHNILLPPKFKLWSSSHCHCQSQSTASMLPQTYFVGIQVARPVWAMKERPREASMTQAYLCHQHLYMHL